MTSGNDKRPTLAIVVGGGPAPGLNGVISAATITAVENGCDVIGIEEGFRWLSKGDLNHVRPLTIDDISRIHLRGGSIIGTSRTNPTKSPELMDNVVKSLEALGVNYMVTIGGDDTAFTSSNVSEHAGGRIRTAHVPKTIDNDLPLPGLMPTFGYMTARHLGVTYVKNLSEDARTSHRWFFVVTMGRTAGHLALGIGKAAGATCIIIPEEFEDRDVTIDEICDILESTIIKRRSMGRDFGVAVLAEGLASRISEDELAQYGTVQHDDHGHIQLSEIDLGQVCKERVEASMKARGINPRVISKELGYELRSADPGPYDMEYTRDLGYGAVKFLLNGGSGALISLQGGTLVPIHFKDIIDPTTGRTRVRLVDVHSETYEVARMYMLRMHSRDFEDSDEVQRMADAGNMSVEALTERFAYLDDGPPTRYRPQF